MSAKKERENIAPTEDYLKIYLHREDPVHSSFMEESSFFFVFERSLVSLLENKK